MYVARRINDHVENRSNRYNGYGSGVRDPLDNIRGVTKMAVLLYKIKVYKQLLHELQDIWPMQTDDLEVVEIKMKSLRALRLFQSAYVIFNELAVGMYVITAIVVFIYRRIVGQETELGFLWNCIYPFDKYKPVYRELVFIFEVFVGQYAVLFMLSSDLLFTALTSHISMFLRLLQLKIRRLSGVSIKSMPANGSESWNLDCYEEIESCVQVHQRLIKYFYDLEDTFSFVNLMTVLVSAVDICCVVFVIVLIEPWMEVGNKFFLCGAVAQIGILCWYADELHTTSLEVGDAIYGSSWHRFNVRCQSALLQIIRRSQKPLCYTTMKFSNITLRTYTSTLTTAYSYFTLLYTMYDGI